MMFQLECLIVVQLRLSKFTSGNSIQALSLNFDMIKLHD